ncbi:MAG: CDP-glycerol glycerophosphotransferase family protein [Mobilitalea sp.]
MIKKLGYYLFALVYYICKPFPIKNKSVLCIMTHDDGEGSNVRIAARAFKELADGYTFSYITKSETRAVKSLRGMRTVIAFFFQKPYDLARAEIVLLDNIFIPLAYLHTKKKTKVVQLWHGTGSIKKFGQDVNTGKLKQLEKSANSNVTHLIVNSPEMKKLYSSAFGINEEFIYTIGLPKTDELLMRIKKIELTKKNLDKEYIYQKYNIPKERKLILYAPTFRDNEISNPKMFELLKKLSEELPDDYCIGLRLHPFIAKQFKLEQMDQRIFQLSFEKDVNSLLLASDLLITDYSSIIFEYCLTERPMIFYAYDYAEFSDLGRGFYYDYESYVPGPVAYSSKEVVEIIKTNCFERNRVKEFSDDNYFYMDGDASKRLIELLK